MRKLTPENYQRIAEIRANLLRAFAHLRRNGIYARANHLCCQSCAGSDIWNMYQTDPKFAEKYKGYVYWHAQDEEGFQEGFNVWLAYGGFKDDQSVDLEVAKQIMEVLKKYDVPADWNGSTSTRIEIQIVPVVTGQVSVQIH